jgi:hypothetical protein
VSVSGLESVLGLAVVLVSVWELESVVVVVLVWE